MQKVSCMDVSFLSFTTNNYIEQTPFDLQGMELQAHKLLPTDCDKQQTVAVMKDRLLL